MAFVPFKFTVGKVEVQGEIERLPLSAHKQLKSLTPPVSMGRAMGAQGDGMIENWVLQETLRKLQVKVKNRWQDVELEEGVPLKNLPEIDDPIYVTDIDDEIMRQVVKVNFFLYLNQRFAQVFGDYAPPKNERVQRNPTKQETAEPAADTSTGTA